MTRISLPYKRHQCPLTDAQRMDKLHHELQACINAGCITEREGLCLMEVALRVMREKWEPGRITNEKR